mgnify:CR=1 FL=1
MKTNVAATSLAAYWSLRDAGELPEKERIVYDAIMRNGPVTREQIAAITGMKEGSACGRVAKLLERGMLAHHGYVTNRITGKTNERVWIAPHRVAMQQELGFDREAA